MKGINKKIPRREEDLLEALSENLDLLNDAIEETISGNWKYLKVIKSILRILVHKGGMNKPLLIDFAKKHLLIPMAKIQDIRGARGCLISFLFMLLV